MKIDDALNEVLQEYTEAKKKFPPFRSMHEGHSIIQEEFDELWEEIKKFPKHDYKRIKKETIQVCTMALRFLVDLT